MATNISPILFQALNFQVNELFAEALPLYTQMLTQNQTYEIYIFRALCFIQQNDIPAAIKDCENAIAHAHGRHEGYFRRGICNFKLGSIISALIDLEYAKETLGKQEDISYECKVTIGGQIQKWIEKCQAEKENITLDKAMQLPQKSKEQIKSEVEKVEAPIKTEESKQAVNQVQSVIKSSTGKIAYSWYQTDEKVVIEIFHALADQSQLKTQFKAREIELSFPLNQQNDYNLQLELFEEIEAEKTEVRMQLKQIDIIMFKMKKNQQWDKLEKDGNNEAQQTNEPKKDTPLVETKVPVYPSSSKYKKDWSKLEKEIDKEFASEKNDDPMAGIFGEIYRNADENTKRAMIKSYQTSGGTVLSTNWDEVKAKDYEGKDRPEAPKGQTWQQWEK